MADHRLVKLGTADYGAILTALFGPSLIGYWKGAEPSGSVALDSSGNGRNGAYTAVTLAQPGIGDGLTSTKYDGSTSLTNIYGTSLAAAFNGSAGTLGIWGQVNNSGVWTDGISRRLLSLAVSATNRVNLTHAVASNNLIVNYIANSVTKSVTITTSTLGWFQLGITWDQAADKVIAYFNGIQSGATQTGLGVWSGSLSSTLCLIGSDSTTPVGIWNGNLAHAFVLNRAAAASEFAGVALLAGA